MYYKKFSKEKASINHITISNSYNNNFKHSGKNIAFTSYQNYDAVQIRSYQTYNMKITEIKSTNKLKHIGVTNSYQYNNIFLKDILNLKNIDENYCNDTIIKRKNSYLEDKPKDNKFSNNIVSNNIKYNELYANNKNYINENQIFNLKTERNELFCDDDEKNEIFENIREFITYKKEIKLNEIENKICNINTDINVEERKKKKIINLNLLKNYNNNINENDNNKKDNNLSILTEQEKSIDLDYNIFSNNINYTTDYSNNIDNKESLKYMNYKNFLNDESSNEYDKVNKNNSKNFFSKIHFVNVNNNIFIKRNDSNYSLNNNNNKFINIKNNYKNFNVKNILNRIVTKNENDNFKLNNENYNYIFNNNNDIIKIKDNINEKSNNKNENENGTEDIEMKDNYTKIKNENDIEDIEMKDEKNINKENNNNKNIELKEIKSDIEMNSSNEEEKILNNSSSNILIKTNNNKIKNNIIKGDESEETMPTQNIPVFLPCREKEQEIIYNYLKTGLDTKGNYSSLYISGMPGTGKTESINRVIDILYNELKKDPNNLNKFQLIYINGIEYSNPKNVFNKIYEAIFIKKNNSKSNIKSLDNFFKYRNQYNSSIYLKNPNNCHIILILDEIDLLIDKSQFLLYNIFNWTTYPNSKFIVTSISNTLDLPNKLLPKVKSRMGNNKLLFKPYTKEELYKIIVSQGINIKNYDEDALKLSSMKVAAVNGDLRRIIKILNKSKEILEEENRDLPKPSYNNIINKFHVLKACSELFDSKITKVLNALEISEKIILITLLQKINDKNENRICVGEIFDKKDKFLEKYNENSYFELDISWDEYQKIIYNLCRLKIISFFEEKKDNFINNYIVIKFYSDEFISACEMDEDMKPLLDLLNI